MLDKHMQITDSIYEELITQCKSPNFVQEYINSRRVLDQVTLLKELCATDDFLHSLEKIKEGLKYA